MNDGASVIDTPSLFYIGILINIRVRKADRRP